MSLTTASELGFAVAAGVAVAALAGAGFRLVGRAVLGTLTGITCGIVVAEWVAFAFRPARGVAVSAGGATVAVLAAASSLALARSMRRLSRLDSELERARVSLVELVEREAAERGAELDRLLARVRADSVSLLAEQERRLAEERRQEMLDRERSAHAELLERLASTQKQVEQRLQEWAGDLERSAEGMRSRLAELSQRQRQLIAEAETRITAEAERLATETEEQREAVARLRTEVQRAIEETSTTATAELDAQAVERRRALHELEERLRRRERELNEQIDREENEAARRIQAGLVEVQRRQIEQLERAVERAGASFADEATQQFASQIKNAREDAARRLARELDRAVAAFAREAEGILAERLAHVGDAGAQRVERRLAEVMSGLDRQRDDFVRAFESHLVQAEDEMRRRLGELAADAEAERAIIEARLQELSRRVDETSSLRAG